MKMTENVSLLAELKVSYSLKKTTTKLDSTRLAANYLREIWNIPMISLQEQFYAIFLNQRLDVLGWRMISTSKSNCIDVDIKLLCSIAVQSMCVAVIVSHNHPSGNLLPSKSDIAMTWRLEKTLKIFDIRLLDHIILTKDFYYSFVDHAKMENLYNSICY
jgi:DNA repair protein RadC